MIILKKLTEDQLNYLCAVLQRNKDMVLFIKLL
jgi:hypothetical protein